VPCSPESPPVKTGRIHRVVGIRGTATRRKEELGSGKGHFGPLNGGEGIRGERGRERRKKKTDQLPSKRGGVQFKGGVCRISKEEGSPKGKKGQKTGNSPRKERMASRKKGKRLIFGEKTQSPWGKLRPHRGHRIKLVWKEPFRKENQEERGKILQVQKNLIKKGKVSQGGGIQFKPQLKMNFFRQRSRPFLKEYRHWGEIEKKKVTGHRGVRRVAKKKEAFVGKSLVVIKGRRRGNMLGLGIPRDNKKKTPGFKSDTHTGFPKLVR